MKDDSRLVNVLIKEPPSWAGYCNYLGTEADETAVLEGIRRALNRKHPLGSTQASVFWRIDPFSLAVLCKILPEIEEKGGQVLAVLPPGESLLASVFFNFARVRQV